MADMWMPGATRKSVGNTGAMNGGAAKATWHATSNINADGKDNAFYLESSYFAGGGKGSAPHLIWDPFTGEIAQYFPADSRALALRNHGSNQSNRSGKYNIQIEVVFAKGMTRGGKRYTHISETPCKNLSKIMAWLRSLGIKDTWPGGAPADWVRDTVSWDTYHTKSGHYGHHQVPGNDHTDPGKMPNLFSTTGGGSTPTPAVPPKETTDVASTHKVVKDDTLWDLSRKYKVSVDDLKKWNGLKSDTLSIGQVLKVKAPASGTHTVAKGDTLWAIAKKYKTTVAELKKLNSLKSDTLSIGQKLKVNGAASKPAAKPWLWFENVGNTRPNNSNKIVQNALNKVMKSKLLVDGKWGPATSGVYKKWQESLYGKGPDSDGKAGKDSLTKLGKKAGFEVRYKPKAPTVEFSNVRYGATNNDIKAVQTALNKNGAKLAVDGNYGNLTKAAVTAYQKKMKLIVDGVAGPQTLGKLGFKDKPGGGSSSGGGGKVTASNYETQPEPGHDYTRVYWGGRLVNRRTARMLDNAVSIYGRSFTLTQGSYNRGGVSASADTHDGGGAVDVNTNGHDRQKLNLAMRMAGFAYWDRYAPTFSPHGHGIAIGDREASSGAKSQVQEYLNGGDGLVGPSSGRQFGYKWPNWVDKYNR